MCASDLSSRDGVQAQMFLTSGQSPLFWQQCHALEALARPVATFSGWLRGCARHGAESMSPACASCPWKGCRARELAQRVKVFVAEPALLRDVVTAPEHGWTHYAVTRMLVVAEMKLSWVHDLPFIIWQVDSALMAAHFLATYDTA